MDRLSALAAEQRSSQLPTQKRFPCPPRPRLDRRDRRAQAGRRLPLALREDRLPQVPLQQAPAQVDHLPHEGQAQCLHPLQLQGRVHEKARRTSWRLHLHLLAARGLLVQKERKTAPLPLLLPLLAALARLDHHPLPCRLAFLVPSLARGMMLLLMVGLGCAHALSWLTAMTAAAATARLPLHRLACLALCRLCLPLCPARAG